MRHHRRLTLALATLWLVLLGSSGAAAEREVIVYKPNHRLAEELVPLARSVLAGRGEASLDPGTNSVVLAGPDDAVAETLALLRELDRAPQSIELTWTSERVDALQARGIRIDWNVGGDSLRIGNVVFPQGQRGIRLRAAEGDLRREGRFEGTLRLTDGERDTIESGSARAVRHATPHGTQTIWLEAGSGFDARARVLGDGRIRVELWPRDSGFAPDGSVHFTSGALTVTVRPGETVAIGGVSQSTATTSESARASGDSSGQSERLLLLHAELR